MFLLNATMRKRILAKETHRYELAALIITISKEAGRANLKGQSDCLCSIFDPLTITEKIVRVLGFSMF